jgi:hypothetical protein
VTCGPAGAVNFIVHGLVRGALSKGDPGFFVPPTVRRRRVCVFRHTISDADAPDLQAWRGMKTAISVYGDRNYAATYCRGLGEAFLSGF